MLLKPVVYDGQFQRKLNQGDTLAGAEVYPATIATTDITVTGKQMATGFIARSPTATATSTIESAANIIAGLSSGTGNVGVAPGTTFRCKWQVTTAYTDTITVTANTGITATLPTVNASSVKEFLVTIVNGTPARTYTGNTTNASAVVTGMSLEETSNLSPGMVVTNAVNGLQATTILSVQPGVGVTMSGNANATSTSEVAISFSPVVTLQGIGQGLI